MKKTLVSALTTALVVGAASTTFAAANPFSDVPADHWAYDAVQQLAQDGVIEGYGDGTFRGQQNITRYEMAQMIAKAMTKADTSAADKALIDKLAAEFSDELKNLGVRVSNLESKVDNVKWSGQLRYDFINKISHQGSTSATPNDGKGASRSQRAQRLILRLTPTFTINDHWKAKARLDFSMSTNAGMSSSVGEKSGAYGENYQQVDQLYAEGKYGNTTIKLGRYGAYDAASHGMIIDDNVTGIQVSTGKDVQLHFAAGRYSYDPNRTTTGAAGGNDFVVANGSNSVYANNTANYIGVDVTLKKNKFGAGVGWRRFSSKSFFHQREQGSAGDDYRRDISEWGYTESNGTKHAFQGDNLGIWSVGFDYTFDNKWKFIGDYSKAMNGGMDRNHSTAYSLEVDYGRVANDKPRSFMVFLAYRQLSHIATMVPTYQNSLYSWQKGWDMGFRYMFAKNMKGSFNYFKGKNYGNGSNQSRIFTRLEFMF